MNLILQLIVGGVIGWLASIVMKTNARWASSPTSSWNHRRRHRRVDRHQAPAGRGLACRG